MLFSDKITLRSVTITCDSDGYPVETNVDTEVWANKKSVSRAEFYSANQAGINMTQTFEVHTEDWDEQTYVLYETETYKVERAYQKGLGTVELNCSDKAV